MGSSPSAGGHKRGRSEASLATFEDYGRVRLARSSGSSERFWRNLQERYDCEVERDRLGSIVDDIHPLAGA